MREDARRLPVQAIPSFDGAYFVGCVAVLGPPRLALTTMFNTRSRFHFHSDSVACIHSMKAIHAVAACHFSRAWTMPETAHFLLYHHHRFLGFPGFQKWSLLSLTKNENWTL